MNAGIVAQGYEPAQMPRALLGQPQPVAMSFGREGDPYWKNVSLYMRMDGQHGSGSFVDSGPNRYAITSFGGAAHTGLRSRFGATSAYFNGSTSYLTAPAGAMFAGTEAFTIEMWWWWDAVASSDCHFVGAVSDGGSGIGIYNFAANITLIKTGGSQYILFGSKSQLVVGRWNHLAVTRTGNVHRCFINGSLDTAGAVTSTIDWGTPTTCRIGAQGSPQSNWSTGYMAELRITRGVARYTSNFAPPPAPYPIGYQ